MELLTSINEATLIKQSKLDAIIMEKILCRLFFKTMETKYVLAVLKISYISTGTCFLSFIILQI